MNSPAPNPTDAAAESISRLAGVLRKARAVVVMTGAGISAESGLRTFRGKESDMSSLWKDFDPMRLATPEAFQADPAMVSGWYDWRRQGCLAAEPNPGHLALAELERRVLAAGGSFTLLTQNVDRLHHRAGTRNVVELHGTIMVWRCTITGREIEPGPEPMGDFPIKSPFHDRGLLRPSVVWFGEALPEAAISAADEATHACDVFISVGTSSVVYPAAGYVEIAHRFGAFTAEVNPAATPVSSRVRCSIRGKAGDVLPRLIHEISRA